VCHALAELARRRFAAVFVQPMAGDTDVSDRLIRLGFRPSVAGVAPAASIAVTLSRSVPQLWGDLRSGTRGSIRRATAHGVDVRRGDSRDLPAVAALLRETAGHHRFSAASLPYLRTLHEVLAPGGRLEIFLAERDGTPLAADVLTSSSNVLTLRLTGMRRDHDARRIGAAALLRWTTILSARAHDYDILDLGGIPASAVETLSDGGRDLSARVDGRTYFKASFGGQPFHHPPAVELLSSTPVRLGYDLARRSALGSHLTGRAKDLLRRVGSAR
jgi:lipid II:glycine glycyltransferase (peptidoglycan interpeptide bridge formation enzyme)